MGVTIAAGVISRIENAGWNRLTVPSLPAPIEFAVLLSMVGLPEDFTDEADRRMRADLSGPGMEELLTIEFEVPTVQVGAEHPAGWEVSTPLPAVIQFTAEREGAYMLSLYLNDRFAWAVPFIIREAAETAEA